MVNRGNLFKEERAIRSELAKLVHSKLFIYGSLCASYRRCGKVNCWCKSQDKGHESSYLSVRVGKKRKLIFVPQEKVKQVKEWIKTYQRINEGLFKITEINLRRLKG